MSPTYQSLTISAKALSRRKSWRRRKSSRCGSKCRRGRGRQAPRRSPGRAAARKTSSSAEISSRGPCASATRVEDRLGAPASRSIASTIGWCEPDGSLERPEAEAGRSEERAVLEHQPLQVAGAGLVQADVQIEPAASAGSAPGRAADRGPRRHRRERRRQPGGEPGGAQRVAAGADGGGAIRARPRRPRAGDRRRQNPGRRGVGQPRRSRPGRRCRGGRPAPGCPRYAQRPARAARPATSGSAPRRRRPRPRPPRPGRRSVPGRPFGSAVAAFGICPRNSDLRRCIDTFFGATGARRDGSSAVPVAASRSPTMSFGPWSR